MVESQAAKTAFAEYLAMGPGRSLEKLAAGYRKQTKPAPPTRLLSTLKKWSRCHSWQARVAAFEQKQNEALVRRSYDEIEQARQENLRLVREAKATAPPPKLDALIKLEMQLLGAPLAEKHEVEHSGAIGLRVQDYDDLSDEELDTLASEGDSEVAEDIPGA